MSEKPTTIERGTVLTYEVAADERLSEGVVAAVSAVSNADVMAMDPLADHVDPDALDALFADRYDGASRAVGTVQFSYADYEIVVTGHGLVTVLDPDE